MTSRVTSHVTSRVTGQTDFPQSTRCGGSSGKAGGTEGDVGLGNPQQTDGQQFICKILGYW